jgi:hypothetical protein
MTPSDYLTKLYKSLTGKGEKALDPDDPCYVQILQANPERDPILALWNRIDLAESESTHLLTGFRGNGKSTELLRLKKALEENGCQVFLVNMLDYVLMTKPLALSDFLLSLMASVAGAVEASPDTDLAPLTRTYWERLNSFLASKVEMDKIDLEMKGLGGAAKLGFKLKTEPEFKILIQRHLEGHLTRLVQDAREFIDGLVVKIREKTGDPDKKVVLLVDSLEQLRGVGEEAETIYSSVVELFSGQASNLSFPKLHVVYTVPPYLPVLSPNLGRLLGGNPVTQWPNIHVRDKKGEPDDEGLNIMVKIIDKRFKDWKSIIPRDALKRLAGVSGGDIRDFFRLVREVVISLRTAQLSRKDAELDEKMMDRVIQQLRNDLLPIASEDAVWLARIHETKQAGLQTEKNLPDLARFLDSNRIMNYLNGEPWYDIHPLLVDEITRMVNSDSRKSV